MAAVYRRPDAPHGEREFQRHDIAEVLEKAQRAKFLSKKGIIESVAHLKEDSWANNVLNSFQEPRGAQP